MTGGAVMAVTERLRGNCYGYGCEPCGNVRQL